MRTSLLLVLVLTTTSCAAFAGPATTYMDKDGMFVAECPHSADACVQAADEHCPQFGYLLDGGILVTRKTEPLAKHLAESGRLRLRCVGSMMTDPGARGS